jgi:hypothetical protein
MYSIKPGRGPSLFGGIAGIAVAILGVFWIGFAASIGAPPFFLLFGVVFVLMAIGGVVYNLMNATQKNRMSTLDVVRSTEEPDLIASALGHAPPAGRPRAAAMGGTKPNFCPYCGTALQGAYEFCPNCGKDV